MRDHLIRGRVWVVTDANGRLIEDIDTDQIFHNAHLHITEISLMGAFAFGNLEGWKDFPQKAKPGDLIVAGRNFGAGSSRQQAVDCFLALGVTAILAPSYSAIYFRNAVNTGFPVLRSEGLGRFVAAGRLRSGDEVEIDLETGLVRILSRPDSFSAEPMSAVQREIYEAGDLFRMKWS
jgi:3-isopropylmalate dehydratase small subunit